MSCGKSFRGILPTCQEPSHISFSSLAKFDNNGHPKQDFSPPPLDTPVNVNYRPDSNRTLPLTQRYGGESSEAGSSSWDFRVQAHVKPL